MKVQSSPFQTCIQKAMLHVNIPSIHPEDPEEVGSTEDAEGFYEADPDPSCSRPDAQGISVLWKADPVLPGPGRVWLVGLGKLHLFREHFALRHVNSLLFSPITLV